MKHDAEIALIDDHQMIREGVKGTLARNIPSVVTSEFRTAESALDAFRSISRPPTAAIVDIGLPDMDGISLTREIRARFPSTAVVIYTMHVTPEYIEAAIAAGALAYVSKSSSSAELLAAVESALDGTPYLDPVSLKMHLAAIARRQEDDSAFPHDQIESLTPQESRVLSLIAQNCSNAMIAMKLSVKPKTVENYVSILYQKTGIKGRFELIAYARRYLSE